MKEVFNNKRKRKAPPLSGAEEKDKNKNIVDSVLGKKTKILNESYSTGMAE